MERIDGGAAVACSLNDEELRERRALARRKLMPRIKARKRSRDGLILTFFDDETLCSDLKAFVALERQCCGFLDFVISADAAEPSSAVELRIEGPAAAAATIDLLFEAVRPFAIS